MSTNAKFAVADRLVMPAAIRWEWIDRNRVGEATEGATASPSSPEPDEIAKVIAIARSTDLELLALYLWLAAVTGARRGEPNALPWADLDLNRGVLHVAYSCLVLLGAKERKESKTHQDRRLAIDEITVTVLAERRRQVEEVLAGIGCELAETAYVFTHEPDGATPWEPGWVTKKVSSVAAAAGVPMAVKSLGHYSG